MASLGIPELNTDVSADPITVLTFVHKIEKYDKNEDEVVKRRILQYALKGKKEKEWGSPHDYKYQPVLGKIVKEVRRSDAWVDLEGRWKKGQQMGSTIRE